MNRYWTRIAIGAGVIFCLGLAGMAAVNKGKAQVRHLLASAGTRIPLQLAHLGFRFEGRQIGQVSGIDVKRSAPGEVGTVTVRVAVPDPSEMAALGECNLTADNLEAWNRSEGFRCASPAEMDRLARIGEVVFQPGDLARPLFVPQGVADRWQNKGIRSLDASMVTDGNGGVTAQGKYALMDRFDGSGRGSFSLKADEAGAVISVRDELGRSLVDFRADQYGVNLNLRDRHGRNLLRLLADSLGLRR